MTQLFVVQKLLFQMVNGKKKPETDQRASIFWLSSPSNIVEENVAIGAIMGIWFELKPRVGAGHPLFLVELCHSRPVSSKSVIHSISPLGCNLGHVAHDWLSLCMLAPIGERTGVWGL
jgi:hypothetical protein